MLYSLHHTISSTRDVAHTCFLASRTVSSMMVGSGEMFIDPVSRQVVESMLMLITVSIINIFPHNKMYLKGDKVLLICI